MKEEFICDNCKQSKHIVGSINTISGLMLVLFMIYPFGTKICDECASTFNAIGFLITFFLLFGLIVVLFLLI
jgi:hypothetical protein